MYGLLKVGKGYEFSHRGWAYRLVPKETFVRAYFKTDPIQGWAKATDVPIVDNAYTTMESYYNRIVVIA